MDNRRKTIVVNKPFQYQYSLLVVALAILGTNLFFIVQMLTPDSRAFDLSSNGAITLGAVEFALIAAVWFGSLRYTHRVAGPIYVFNREICRLGSADLCAAIKLRDKDMFQEEARSMNQSLADLRSRVVALKTTASELESASDGDKDALIAELNSQLAAFKTDTAK